MELFIVRHAQPTRAPGGTPNGDPGLTPEGTSQAKSLSQWLAMDPRRQPDRIISSPMQRALQTAEPAAQACALPVEVDARLAEFDQGAAEYVPLEVTGRALRQQVAQALQTGRWGEHWFDPEAFRLRVAAAFADIICEGAPKRVMVVCHGGVINSYLSQVVDRSHGVFFHPHFASVSRVHVNRAGVAGLTSLNELPQAHLLEQAGADES